jgi:hypothetical protein
VPSARLVRCPGRTRPGQHCFAVIREPDGAVLLLQQRELECSPASRGGYADPAAACRALAGYLRLVDERRVVCDCIVTAWPASLVGVVHGRRVDVGMSSCCLPAAAGADRGVLTPALGT